MASTEAELNKRMVMQVMTMRARTQMPVVGVMMIMPLEIMMSSLGLRDYLF